jgi:hypothetical protein
MAGKLMAVAKVRKAAQQVKGGFTKGDNSQIIGLISSQLGVSCLG